MTKENAEQNKENYALIKSRLKDLEKHHEDFLTELQLMTEPAIHRLIFKKVARSNFDLYNFFHELAKADIGEEEADLIFIPHKDH